ncbi:hypothetical protein SAMN05216184_101176 [Georgenia satyanarayanai]|uniref:AB hydrolase-1 domain-containing protein n=1 Tax=Georgenia satyanarayanai TaxID=860221 RepID=A0A2Y9C2Q8_9MICO|nr:hypothetical protein A8987_101176 [Georgenia satyanarayanai]SSA36513.1 hypothetical protein SAMN05216184_101176 [Georgenia satyanarayanai]
MLHVLAAIASARSTSRSAQAWIRATRAAWRTIPSWALITTQDLAVPGDSVRFMAERAGSHATEIDASHAVSVSGPAAVADIIDAAARATSR